MSSKYYREWEKQNSSSASSEEKHVKILNKLTSDVERLDRALDKMETEEKAKKIFGQNQMEHCLVSSYPTQICANSPVISSSYGLTQLTQLTQPVLLSNVDVQYIMVNGSIVMRKW